MQIESEVIDEIMSVENFAVKIAKDVTADAETVINSVSNEFTNVIGPSLSNVGQEIGSALNVAGADILTGLEDAGKYIEAHPELIAEFVQVSCFIFVVHANWIYLGRSLL